MQVNDRAVDFELPDLHGELHKLSDYIGKIVILNFWSAECLHSERTDKYILALLEGWDGDVIVLPVASNANESAQMMTEAAQARGISQILVDSEHSVADLYEAITTPHVFVFDREGLLRYRGAVDDIAFRRREATQFFLRDAVEALRKGQPPLPGETPSYGCAIVREI